MTLKKKQSRVKDKKPISVQLNDQDLHTALLIYTLLNVK